MESSATWRQWKGESRWRTAWQEREAKGMGLRVRLTFMGILKNSKLLSE